MNETNLKERTLSIFDEALRAVDAGAAVRRVVEMSDPARLTAGGEVFDLTKDVARVYAVALGKAAYPMALALDRILGAALRGGVISGVLPAKNLAGGRAGFENKKLSGRWQVFAGGHPLPDEESLRAARRAADLLRAADDERALIFFLVSGGGSAMIDAPVDESIRLADLRETNRLLVGCGASIREINVLRRAVSRIKGGGLARLAPAARQITLIVSDTENGDEASVASGPTIEAPPADRREIAAIIDRYRLRTHLPAPILRALLADRQENKQSAPETARGRRHHVLLDNRTAVAAAAAAAERCGFVVETDDRIGDQPVEEGCRELLRRANAMRARAGAGKIVCSLSGGEFSCPVLGDGVGGRNAETALRMALLIDAAGGEGAAKTVFLSAGTDGIDGNSPAAGAVADEMTIGRARALRLDARRHLATSDAYSFFRALGDAVVTGPTGTNVRDLRIMLARAD